jgi:GT2 family glycosyltransferase
MGTVPRYSIVLPTYKRPDVLALCLAHIADLDYPAEALEVIVLDNAGAQNSGAVVAPFRGRFPLRFLVNERNLGYGGSVNRGLRLATGRRLVILNDDALLPASFLKQCDRLFDADPSVGCVGCRAIETNYASGGEGVGRIDDEGTVVGNFDRDGERPVEVEHVYGFCYVVTREALDRSGVYDEVLLARPYSSGNRTETDHCLSIRQAGLKVIYDPRIAVPHLAKPRGDMSERSLRWKLNHTRNTLYLFLKHYGLLGKRCLALRFTLLQDIGILSLLSRPSWPNLLYFAAGLRARASAYGHYLLYLAGAR